MVNDDDVSRSSKTSAVADMLEAFRRPFQEVCHSNDRGPLADVETNRNGNLFDAMLCGGDGEDGVESDHFKIVISFGISFGTATFRTV